MGILARSNTLVGEYAYCSMVHTQTLVSTITLAREYSRSIIIKFLLIFSDQLSQRPATLRGEKLYQDNPQDRENGTTVAISDQGVFITTFMAYGTFIPS